MSRSLSPKELRWITSDWLQGKPALLLDLRHRGLPDDGMVVEGLKRMHFARASAAFLAGLSTHSIVSNGLADPQLSDQLFRNRLQLALGRARYTKQHKVAKRMAGGHTHGS